MKTPKKTLALFLTLAMVFSCMAPAFAAEDGGTTGNVQVTRLDSAPRQNQESFNEAASLSQQVPAYSANEKVRAIIIMEDEPTVSSAGSAVSLFSVRRAPTEEDLLETHDELLAEIANEGIDCELNYEYTTLLNGMSVTVEYGDLDAIAELPGVASVHVANTYIQTPAVEAPAGEQQMDYANDLTGVSSLLDQGYDGEGMVIAVLDSGITPEHEVFSTAPENPAIEGDAAVDTLGYGVYFSDKIPFYHDYYETLVNGVDNDTADNKGTFNYDAGGHGTHVSGIAAGYAVDEEGEVTFRGAAPQAQILMMKIFEDDTSNGSTTTDLCFAALEDAYKLGVDVINMSIGWYAGFTYDYDLEYILQNVYQTLEDAGIICCVSVGNYYSIGDANGYNEYAWANGDYSDYGTICAPATYPGTLAVAAAENSAYLADTVLQVGDDYVLYVDETTEDNSENGYTFAQFLEELNGEPVKYVVLPYLGYADEYEEVEIPEDEPWIAVIQRGADPDVNDGVFRFATKIQIAAAQGASAVILYNNESGELYMDLSPDNYAIPAITISQESFNEYFANAESDTITFPAESVEIENSEAGRMTDMSSWGATPDLKIGVDLAAIGGHVRSALAYTTDEYVVYSGTSMASPNMAGNMAALLQYLKENGHTDKVERAQTAKALAESTATTLYIWDGYDNLYSPRKQGAGRINIRNAAEAKSYVVDPICNLGESADGQFTISFTVQNLTDEAQTYDIGLDVMCDDIDSYGYKYMTSYMLYEEYYDYTRVDSQNSVTVPANGAANVTVTIEVDSAWTEWWAWYGGNFVEGYVRLTNTDGSGEELHATFMGFCGDWTDGSVLEQYDWRDSYYYNDTAYNTALNWAYTEDLRTWDYWSDAGENYFLNWYYDEYDYADWDYDEDRIAIPSPESADSAYLNGLYLLPMNIRNAKKMVMVISDAETGEVYYADDDSMTYVSKTYYYSGYGWWTEAYFTYDGTDFDGNPLPNDTKVNVSVYAVIAYGEDVLEDVDWAKADLDLDDYADYLEWSFPCWIDSELPELANAVYDPDAETLTVTLTDNQHLATVDIYGYDADWNEAGFDYRLFYGDDAGQETTVTFDVSGCSGVYLYLDDYATNESWYWIDLVAYHDHTELKYVEAVEPTCTEDGHYEYWYCEECGGYFWDEDGVYVAYPDDTVIPALGHDWGEWKTVKEPTDFTNGLEERTCAHFGETETRIIPALDHVHRMVSVPAQEPTCTEAGNIAYWYCEDCGAYFLSEDDEYGVPASEVVLPALGHDWSEWEANEENTALSRFCYDCSETETIAIPAENIDPTALTYVPLEVATCEKPGNTAYWYLKTEDDILYFADEEGKWQISQSDTVLPALGHDWGEWEIVSKATEDEEGLRVRTCSVCGEEENYVIPVLPHTHELEYVPAKDNSCEEDGNIAHWYCEKCGKYFADADAATELTEDDVITPAHGHDTELVGYKAPTSSRPGYSGDEVCKICGKVIKTGHVIDPTEELFPYVPTRPTKPTVPDKPEEPTVPDEPVKPEEPEEPVYSVDFEDVGTGSWYYEDVAYVAAKDLMNGVDDVHFAPSTNLTRAMLVTILYRMADKPFASYSAAFSDVADGQWYTSPVEWAALNGIVNGYGNGLFGPGDSVTREQLAAILYRYARYMGYDVTASADLSVFPDSAEVSSYAVDAMRWAVAEGLINGSDGKLLPGGYATRAEIAAVIHRFLEKFETR